VLHQAATFAPGGNGSSIEYGLLGFAVLIVILLLIIRVKRSHDRKIRQAASSGFYDFDVAHYGTASAGSSLMEKAVEASGRPLAPSFMSSGRGTNPKGAVAPMPVPSSFGGVDRSPAGPVRAYDQTTANDRGPMPPSPPSDGGAPDLPIPSTPRIPRNLASRPAPPRGSDSESSLPPLVQPPPPSSTPPTKQTPR
jgi:hypothetical protein